MKPLYDLLHDNIKFKWKEELKTLVQQIKSSITDDVTLSLPSTNHPFFNTVVACLTGIGFTLIQINRERNLDIISHKRQIVTINERKLCTKYRELIGVVLSLKLYKNNIFGSDHFTTVLNDHKATSAVLPRKKIFLYYSTLQKYKQPNSKNLVFFYQKKKIFL